MFCYGAADITHQNEEKPKACDFPFGELDVRNGLLLPDQYVKGEYLLHFESNIYAMAN